MTDAAAAPVPNMASTKMQENNERVKAWRKKKNEQLRSLHASDPNTTLTTYSKVSYALRKQDPKFASQREAKRVYYQRYNREKYGCVECRTWPDCRQGWSHYDGMCFRCFKEKHPTHKRVGNRARVELIVRAYIDSHFPCFKHDIPMYTAHCDCPVRRRVDHRCFVGTTLLCIETDEHHHQSYDKDDEQARYHDVMMGWGGKLVFIRFNPDKISLGPSLQERLLRLRAEITRHVARLERDENTAMLEVHHLYYPPGTQDLL